MVQSQPPANEAVYILFTVIFPCLGILFSSGFSLSPMGKLRKIQADGHLDDFDPFPVVLNMASGVSWLFYSVEVQNFYTFISSSSSVLGGAYATLVVYACASQKVRHDILLLVEGLVTIFLLGGVGLMVCRIRNPPLGQQLLGLMANALSLVVYFSPFKNLWKVFHERDASSIFLPWSTLQMFNSTLWTTYALCVNDRYIFVCSLVGLISAALCIFLKFILPSHDGTRPSLSCGGLVRWCMSVGRRMSHPDKTALHHDDHEHGISLIANAHDLELHLDDDNHTQNLSLLSGHPSSSSTAFQPPTMTPSPPVNATSTIRQSTSAKDMNNNYYNNTTNNESTISPQPVSRKSFQSSSSNPTNPSTSPPPSPPRVPKETWQHIGSNTSTGIPRPSSGKSLETTTSSPPSPPKPLPTVSPLPKNTSRREFDNNNTNNNNTNAALPNRASTKDLDGNNAVPLLPPPRRSSRARSITPPPSPAPPVSKSISRPRDLGLASNPSGSSGSSNNMHRDSSMKDTTSNNIGMRRDSSLKSMDDSVSTAGGLWMDV